MNAPPPPLRSEHPIEAHVRLTLRMRRRVLGFTVEALAEAIGVSELELRALERGAAPLTPLMLWRMTQALNCSPNDLFVGLGSRNETGEG